MVKMSGVKKIEELVGQRLAYEEDLVAALRDSRNAEKIEFEMDKRKDGSCLAVVVNRSDILAYFAGYIDDALIREQEKNLVNDGAPDNYDEYVRDIDADGYIRLKAKGKGVVEFSLTYGWSSDRFGNGEYLYDDVIATATFDGKKLALTQGAKQ
jgi:hypothetical protein